MKYELTGGERGSYTHTTGPYSAPLRFAAFGVLGFVFAAILKFAVGRETTYFDPSNEYFPIAMLLLALVAFVPPLAILWSDSKECISLTVDHEVRKVMVVFRTLKGISEESFDFAEVEHFRVERRQHGSLADWYIYLRTTWENELVVAKFRDPHDAERENDEANRALFRGKTWRTQG